MRGRVNCHSCRKSKVNFSCQNLLRVEFEKSNSSCKVLPPFAPALALTSVPAPTPATTLLLSSPSEPDPMSSASSLIKLILARFSIARAAVVLSERLSTLSPSLSFKKLFKRVKISSSSPSLEALASIPPEALAPEVLALTVTGPKLLLPSEDSAAALSAAIMVAT